MNYLSTDEIIVAKSTGDGKSSIDIVKISGPSLVNIYKKITLKNSKPIKNNITKCKLYSMTDKKILDHVMMSYFEGPDSFTGQDIIEINCHGGGYIANHIIDDLCSSGLIRHALPGEFLFRAYYYNKISILEAEAIDDLLQSDSNIYLNKSLENVDGRLSIETKEIKMEIVEILKIIEHELDFNENEINHIENSKIASRLKEILIRLMSIKESFFFSKITKGGTRVSIVGRPNAGKSSLYNYLLGTNRSIVSNKAGTTRDVIESTIEIRNQKIIIVDTAGYTNAEDEIEKIGVQKTTEEIEKSDIILLLAENNNEFNEFEKLIKNIPTIKILTKNDIYNHRDDVCKISVNNKTGLENLLTTLSTEVSLLMGETRIENHYLINRRQKDIIVVCEGKIKKIIEDIDKHDSVILATMIRDVLDIFGDIVDPVSSEYVINEIFSGFCVGK